MHFSIIEHIVMSRVVLRAVQPVRPNQEPGTRRGSPGADDVITIYLHPTLPNLMFRHH